MLLYSLPIVYCQPPSLCSFSQTGPSKAEKELYTLTDTREKGGKVKKW